MFASLVLITALSATPTKDFLDCRYSQMELETTGQAYEKIGNWAFYGGVATMATGMMYGFLGPRNSHNFYVTLSLLSGGFLGSVGGGALRVHGMNTVIKSRLMCSRYNLR